MPKVTEGYFDFVCRPSLIFFSLPFFFFFNLAYSFVCFYDIDVGFYRHKQTLVVTCYFLFVDPCSLDYIFKISSGSVFFFIM